MGNRRKKLRKNPDKIARALIAADLCWEVPSHYHWRIPTLQLDIWPTRWKTMWRGNVKAWDTIEDFAAFLARVKAADDPVTTGDKFNEADWKGLQESGDLPWS